VELNPVRAGLVAQAWDWPWSSARAHITGVDDTGLLKMDRWAARFDGKSWRAFLEEGMGRREEQDEIRLATRTGRPLGSEEFISKLESITGRHLRIHKPGRRPKQRP
jgi:putative transposase